jgi:hypothetical protein
MVCIAVLAVASLGVSVAKADVLLEWNEIMTTAVGDQPPPDQNRVAAITQLAVFEAVNAVAGDFEPYLSPVTAAHGASLEAGVVSAAHAALTHYFPDQASILDAARVRSLATIPDSPARDAGIAAGQAAAAGMIAARSNDGSEVPEFHLPPSSRPGEWQLTPDCPPEGGVFLHFRKVTPFGIRHARQFRSAPPPRLGSRRYTEDYNEVKRVGGAESMERSPAQATVAEFYAVFSDAPLWNAVARQIASARRKSLVENARAFALLNMALSDAGVAVLETKYHYNFWRPETAIQNGDADRNRRTDTDPSFAPFIVAPCFPSYPSGHATTSYAAREIIERIYGRGPHRITLSRPDVTLNYARLEDITRDIDDARVYSGIHFRFDQEEAAEQGRRLGEYVYKHKLRRARDADDCREKPLTENQGNSDRSVGPPVTHVGEITHATGPRRLSSVPEARRRLPE